MGAVVKFQIKPTILLLPSRLDDLEKPEDDESEKSYHVQIRPTAEFAYEGAERKLIALNIGEFSGPCIQAPSDLHDLSSDGHGKSKLLRLAAWINLNSRTAVGCAGAVLVYLQRKKAIQAGTDRNEGLQIGSIEMVSLANVM